MSYVTDFIDGRKSTLRVLWKVWKLIPQTRQIRLHDDSEGEHPFIAIVNLPKPAKRKGKR